MSIPAVAPPLRPRFSEDQGEKEVFRSQLAALAQKGDGVAIRRLADLARTISRRGEWGLLGPYMCTLEHAKGADGLTLYEWSKKEHLQTHRLIGPIFRNSKPPEEPDREAAEEKSVTLAPEAELPADLLLSDRDTSSTRFSLGRMEVESFDPATGMLSLRWPSFEQYQRFHRKVAYTMASLGHYVIAKHFTDLSGGTDDIVSKQWIQKAFERTADAVKSRDQDEEVHYRRLAEDVSEKCEKGKQAYKEAIQNMRKYLGLETAAGDYRLDDFFEDFKTASQLNRYDFAPHDLSLRLAPAIASIFPARAEALINKAYQVSPVQTFNACLQWCLFPSRGNRFQPFMKLFLKRFPLDLLAYAALNARGVAGEQPIISNGPAIEQELREKFAKHLADGLTLIRKKDFAEAREEFVLANRYHISDTRPLCYIALIDILRNDLLSATKLRADLTHQIDWFDPATRVIAVKQWIQQIISQERTTEAIPRTRGVVARQRIQQIMSQEGTTEALPRCPEIPVLTALIQASVPKKKGREANQRFLEAIKSYYQDPNRDLLWASFAIEVAKRGLKNDFKILQPFLEPSMWTPLKAFASLSASGASLSEYEGNISPGEEGEVSVSPRICVACSKTTPEPIVVDPGSLQMRESVSFLREVLDEGYNGFSLFFARVASLDQLSTILKTFSLDEVPLYRPFWTIFLERLSQEGSWPEREPMLRWIEKNPSVWQDSMKGEFANALCKWTLCEPILPQRFKRFIRSQWTKHIENKQLEMAHRTWDSLLTQQWTQAAEVIDSFFTDWKSEEVGKIDPFALRSLCAARVLFNNQRLAKAMPREAKSVYHAQLIGSALSLLARECDLHPYVVPEEQTGAEFERRELYRLYIGQRRGEDDLAYSNRLKELRFLDLSDLSMATQVNTTTPSAPEDTIWVVPVGNIPMIEEARTIIQEETSLHAARCAKNEEIASATTNEYANRFPAFAAWVERTDQLPGMYLDAPKKVDEYLRTEYPSLDRKPFLEELKSKADWERAFRALRTDTPAPAKDPSWRFWQLVQQTAELIERVSLYWRSEVHYDLVFENQEEARFAMQLIYEWSVNARQHHKQTHPDEKFARGFHGPETHVWGEGPRIPHFNAGIFLNGDLVNIHLFFKKGR